MCINLRKMTYHDILFIMDKTIPKLVKRIAETYPALVAQYSRNDMGGFDEVSFSALYSQVVNCSAGLLSLGNKRKDHIGIISDNRKEWFQTSLAIMAIGAADVPRGSDATQDEITYILSFAECKTVFLENNSQALKVLKNRKSFPNLSTVIMYETLSDTNKEEFKSAKIAVYSFDEIISLGMEFRAKRPDEVEAEIEKGREEEIATIIFTSGTTGEPKGVMLTHSNFLCQLPDLSTRILLSPGDRSLCVLPVWHSFERLCEYVILNAGSGIIYSKPVGSILLGDFKLMNPSLMPSVPRIWESVYEGIFRAMRKKGGVSFVLFAFFVNLAIVHARCARAFRGNKPIFSLSRRWLEAFLCFLPWILLSPLRALGNILVFKKIQEKLGVQFVGGVSGGGALPPNIDEFFWAVGIKVVEGYGLTETAPVVAVRPFTNPSFGTIGTPLSCCEVRIVDESGNDLPVGVKGTVLVRGKNVMAGYYRRPDLTAKVLSDDGWLDTGDLGLKTLKGEIILRGRKKDTIVLRGGENIEPTPIEMKINESRFIAASVVLGQDQRYLGAFIVASRDDLIAWAEENMIEFASFSSLLENSQVLKLFEGEISNLVNAKNGFKLFERINRFVLLEKPFEQGVELSAKQEIMRYKLDDLYRKQMKKLFI